VNEASSIAVLLRDARQGENNIHGIQAHPRPSHALVWRQVIRSRIAVAIHPMCHRDFGIAGVATLPCPAAADLSPADLLSTTNQDPLMQDRSASRPFSDRSRCAAWACALALLFAALLSACGGSSSGADDRSAASATEPARQHSADTAAAWAVVAPENGRFQITGTRLTRYGVEGHWVERSFTDTDVECGNATYGDPIIGTVKECQIQGGAAPAAGGAVITVQAASQECEGRADLALNIKGAEVTRWRGILGNARDAVPQYQQLSYQHPSDFALADVEIAFVNDYWTPACNRNVRVANVAVQRVGGAVEQVALASTTVFSTGTWSDAEKCSGRSVQSEWLDCDGAFRFGGTGAPAPTPTPGKRISASFEAMPDNFTNPERGLHRNTSMVTSDAWGSPTLSTQRYAAARAEGITLIRGIALLDKYRGGPLPEAVLDEMRRAFRHARTAGVKIWLLVTYNFPTTETDRSVNIDPPLATVLQHLDQLKPVLEENQDVLAGLYNGFIGAWGEWHSSSTGLDKDPQRRQIYEKIHAVLPSSRMMTVRQFEAIETLPGNRPNASNAQDQTYATRTGMTNQCYLVNKTDAGTYAPDKIEQQKTLLSEWSRYLPMVAETCQFDGPERHDDCASAPAENERMHMSVMNVDFYEPTITSWKQQGCFKDITDRLGYRLQLTTASVAGTVAAGSALDVEFAVKNTGYAAPYNPRGLAVVLRNRDTGARHTLPILQERNDTLDPRRWLRESGEITVRAAPMVPADVPAGSYDVLLSLHDPMPNLSARPEYSIRLANKDVWETNTGLNRLVSGVMVTR
jgi:Domain of unknown function (DUF4832)/Domain of unknown function (DUF4874)